MYIRIIAIGKTKDSYLQEGITEYIKRISPFARTEIIILEEYKSTKNTIPDEAKAAEAELILKNLKKDETIIALDENGKNPNSKEFAHILKESEIQGKVCFIIGGHFGLHESVFGKVDKKLSLSNLTFTHQMIRLILLEQIYRGFCINTRKKYHY